MTGLWLHLGNSSVCKAALAALCNISVSWIWFLLMNSLLLGNQRLTWFHVCFKYYSCAHIHSLPGRSTSSLTKYQTSNQRTLTLSLIQWDTTNATRLCKKVQSSYSETLHFRMRTYECWSKIHLLLHWSVPPCPTIMIIFRVELMICCVCCLHSPSEICMKNMNERKKITYLVNVVRGIKITILLYYPHVLL